MMQRLSRPSCVALFPVYIYRPRTSVYGAWPKASQPIIDSFLKNLGRTPVHNIQTHYYDSASVHIASTVNFNAWDVYPDKYSLVRVLSGADLQTING